MSCQKCCCITLIIMGIIFVILVYFVAMHHKSMTTCKLPNSEDGQCVEISSCAEIMNPSELEDIRMRKESCLSEELLCCKVQKNEEHIFDTEIIEGQIKTPLEGTHSKIEVEFKIENHPNYKLFNMSTCGRASAANRVAYGMNATLFEFPWAVRLGYKYNSFGKIKYQCGGTLISDYYVLTAAHCLKNKNNVDVKSIRLGEHDETTDKDCIDDDNCADPVQDIEVESFIGHPEYDDKQFINDIGLIRLKKPANLTQNNIRAICLPFHESATRQTDIYTVTGWGATEKSTAFPVLQKAFLKHFDFDECRQNYSMIKANNENSVKITDGQICAIGKGKIDTCKGDSGMALQAPVKLQIIPQVVQYGIVSFGAGKCGQLENFPGVYTKVTKYMRWLLDNMN